MKGIELIDNCTGYTPIDMLQSDAGNIAAMALAPNANSGFAADGSKFSKIVQVEISK